jgi:hypothetical protein
MKNRNGHDKNYLLCQESLVFQYFHDRSTDKKRGKKYIQASLGVPIPKGRF